MKTPKQWVREFDHAKCRAFKDFVREPFVWPGGYAKIMLCSDGGLVCHTCAKREAKTILHSTLFGCRDGWMFAAVDVNWEDSSLYCDHCGERMPSEYAG